MKYTIAFMMLLCVPFGALYGDQSIALKKVFFHQGSSENPHHIEVGNLVFYLENKPHIESSIVPKGKTTLQRLFLPHVTVSPELKERLQQIQSRTKEHSYAMHFKELPNKGLEITLIYPTKKIGVTFNHFHSISLQKGIKISFYDKDMIDRIKQLGKGVITTASLSAPHVFIDCGHGGSDCGAVAHALCEKDLSLQVGLLLADQLRAHDIVVDLSRDTDITKALDERTTMANQKKADLFISIHANAAPNSISQGIETYFFDPGLLGQEMCSLLNGDERACIAHLMHEKYNNSNRLAACVHNNLLKQVATHYPVHNRNTKAAVSQVLLGTQMPSILVEIGFITHPQEAQLLAQKTYQHAIAEGVSSGILHYLGRA